MTQPHRGLPPPAAMTLRSSSPASSLIPIPSHIWQNSQHSDETVRSLLQVVIEQNRHASELEKTKQEELKLRSREIELRIREIESRSRDTQLTMLREALQGGLPGPEVAMMLTGPHSRGTAEFSHDSYAGEYRQPSRPPPQPTPELRRETRLIGPAVPGSSIHQQPMAPPAAAAGPAWDSHQPGYSSYHAPRGGSNRSSQSGQSQAVTSHPAAAHSRGSRLPQINTNEGQKPGQLSGPAPALNPSPMPHPTPQSSATVETPQVTQSPSILYFHHWQPPPQVGSQSSAQRASSPQRQLGSPFPHAHPQPHLSGSEVSSSPKRRKTTSGHPYSPPYQAATGSGSNVTPARRSTHSRQRSDTGTTGVRSFEPYHRPAARQRRSDTVSGHGDELAGASTTSEPMQTSPDAGSATQQGSGQEQGGRVPLQQQQQQQQQQEQQPPSRSYSPGPDRSRDLPYPGGPPGEAGQPPQGGNGRH